ncbi:nucleotidyltransferase family protein [Pseudoalteromonas sp. MMG006]|uniref:nucleotidyltransferase family protein n=1 Tax=Pseudoalteromonas sp. MMG006 TaxID=2822683 RepID=UPI001B36D6AA|nr:nucleotidyltransferase family protein [Pseudoalteromonas sp. MMG006]
MLIAKVILAAGQSSRFKGCKLIANVGFGQTMIERAVKTLQALDDSPVYVVTGAWHKEIEQALCGYTNIQLIENKQWDKGLGGSIATASEVVSKINNYDGFLFMLCDQVQLQTQHLSELVKGFTQTPSRWCADYGERLGVPAIFPAVDLSKLASLTSDKGAQHLLRSKNEIVNTINISHAKLDIDTQEQLSDFLSKHEL